MPRKLAQFAAVLKKSFLIKASTPFTTFAEFFLPIIFLGLLTLLKKSGVPVESLFRILLSMTFSISMASLISVVVHEREQRISEMMKILGLSSWIYFSSWFVFYALMMTITSIFVAGIKILGEIMPPETNFVVVFLYYFLFSVSSVSFALFISTPFDSAKVAQSVGFMVYGMISVLGLVIEPEWSSATKRVVGFFLPPLAYTMGLTTSTRTGMRWSTLSAEYLDFSVESAMIFMGLSTLFYFFLYVYLDQIIPRAIGTRKSWWFPFEVCFKRNKRTETSSLPLSKAGNIVETRGLSKHYSGSRAAALSNVDMTFSTGELTVLLGQNGAGKTTLINILTGMTEASLGSAHVFGQPVDGTNLAKVREMTGFCPQHDIQWPQLTVRDHFEIFGALRGLAKSVIHPRMEQLLVDVGLVGKSNAPISTLSGGMKRKLSVALAFLGDSKLVILDEPTSGLDPLSRRHMWTVLGKMRQDRVLLVSTHYMDEAEVLGERVVILADGKVRANGSVNELRSEYDCGYEIGLKPKKKIEKEMLERLGAKVVKADGSGNSMITVTIPVADAGKIPSLLSQANKEIDIEDEIEIKAKRLEEVFMKIALEGTVRHQVKNESLAAVDYSSTEYVESRISLLGSQILGTFLKRWRMFFREKRASFIQNLFPLVTLACGLIIAQNVRDKLEGERNREMKSLFTDFVLVLFVQIAFSGISGGILSSLAREAVTGSKSLQYVAGLMPVAYWLGSYVGDVTEFFALPFTYTSVLLAAVDLQFPIGPILALLACFGPAIVAQSYALTSIFTNPTIARFTSTMLTIFCGFGLAVLFTILRFEGRWNDTLDVVVVICRIFPTFNLGDGIFSLTLFNTGQTLQRMSRINLAENKSARDFVFNKIPAVAANSPYDNAVLGTPIIWLLAATPLLLALAILVDDLRYTHRTVSLKSRVPPVPADAHEDESVMIERQKVENPSTNNSLAVRAVNVSKQYGTGSALAVNRVPLALENNGEIFTLLGENGAGKTTLMTMAIGQILPSEGNIYIDTHNTRTQLKQARQLIGYCPQFDALLLALTVKDHLRLFARIKGIKSSWIDSVVQKIIARVGLENYENAKVNSLSGGYKRRLSLAIALMGKPQVLILDEPSCGMDPVARRQMWQVMESASQDSAVILTTHSMEEAEAVSTRLGIMADGRMKCMGTAAELRERFSNGVEVFVQIHSLEDSSMEFEAQARSAITGISNFEGSGRSVLFVVEPENKLITIDFIASIFSFLEAGKHSRLVADYSVSQNSLDQVFRSIASRDHFRAQ